MEILLLVVSIIFFLVGIFGLIVPIIPDLVIVWLGVLIYAIGTGFKDIALLTVIILGFLSLTTYLIDFVTVSLGAKKYGASKSSVLGGIVGGFIGIFLLPPLGFVIGFIAGVIGVELLILRNSKKQAIKSAKGVILGFILSFLVKTILAGVIISVFAIAVLN